MLAARFLVEGEQMAAAAVSPTVAALRGVVESSFPREKRFLPFGLLLSCHAAPACTAVETVRHDRTVELLPEQNN